MVDRHLELVWSRARGGAAGALLALMDAAERDPDAARGLMSAYGGLPKQDRARLVETIVDDGRAAGRSVAGTLALLLSAEQDPTLAQAIAGGLDRTVAHPEHDRAWRWGTSDEGGIVIVRHLHGCFVEALRLTWTPGSLAAEGDSLLAFDEPTLRQRYGVPETARSTLVSDAIDRMAEAVWRARQLGVPFPADLRRFAHVFSVRSVVDVGDADEVD